jgi:hypothetical protein
MMQGAVMVPMMRQYTAPSMGQTNPIMQSSQVPMGQSNAIPMMQSSQVPMGQSNAMQRQCQCHEI